MALKTSDEYKTFIEEIKRRVRASQYAAFKAVNKELISLYWDIGKRIVEQQNKLGWGKAIVETMAKDLQKEFPGIQGFSSQNLWRMKQFFQVYSSNAKLSPMVREIGWTHNMIILANCKNNPAREFYLSALNERDKLEGENPAIGIIICKSKSRTVVEYALKDVHKPIGVSTYSIKKALPKIFRRYLPSSKELAASVTVS